MTGDQFERTSILLKKGMLMRMTMHCKHVLSGTVKCYFMTKHGIITIVSYEMII